ncbi:MAG: hypothetical protein COB04_02890 [Gammaproteobacteria bacterium]|nr:MAG: hypothetical protein COB04_02890 [Gammaproteobacteria bacterium]
MIKRVLQFIFLSLFMQPCIVWAQPYKCLLITEHNTDFIQYFDIGDHKETLKVAKSILTVQPKDQILGVKRMVECVPSDAYFHSHTARELDNSSPK